MSAETQLQQVLTSATSVTALVGTRIAEGGAPNDWAIPFIVYEGTHDTQLVLLGEDGERVSFKVRCWSDSASVAETVAEAVKTALRAYNQAQTDIDVTILSEDPISNLETGLLGREVTVDWWPD